MTTKSFLVAGALAFFLSCSSDKQDKPSSFNTKIEHVISKVIYGDSLSKPSQINAPHLPTLPAGNPKKVMTNNNVWLAGAPEKMPAFNHTVVIPGINGSPLPLKAIAVHKKRRYQSPEVVLAENAATNDKYPQNFSFFGRLQGLASDHINSLYEDTQGNLWIGTGGSGVDRYDGRTFTHFAENEGLGENFVRHIVQDLDGNMWFGTLSKGISKYDGTNFTNYTVKEGLSANWISGMAVDKQNRIWIGTSLGVNVYDGKYFACYRKDIIGSDTVLALMADKKGEIWISTPKAVVNYNGKVFNQYSFKGGHMADRVHKFSEDVKGNIWCCTGNGLLKFDKTGCFRFTKSQGLLSNPISSVVGDKDGNLWIAYNPAAITKFDGKTMTHFKYEDGLNIPIIWNLLEDRRGNLWIATLGGGLNKYAGQDFNHFTVYDGLNSNYITGILEDSGNIWLSTLHGVSKYDQKSFTHFTYSEGLIYNVVWGMMKDHKNNLWFGTWQGVSKYDGKTFTNITQKEGLGDNDVKCILEDKNGNIWFGTKGGVTRYDGRIFTRYSGKDGLGDDVSFCHSMMEDRNGNLWFGTSGGITKYDGRDFTNFIIDEKCGNNGIYSIIEDRRGYIWFGTRTCGLLMYDGSSFRRYNKMDGLGSNDVSSVIEDKLGNIWCGTDNGISKLDNQKIIKLDKPVEYPDKTESRSTPLFESYTYDDGFLGQGGRPGKTIYETTDGTIWIGAKDRLTAFHPAERQDDTIAPHIQLVDVSLFNENIPWQSLLTDDKQEIRDTTFVLTNGKRVHHIRFKSLSRWYGTPNGLSLAHNNNFISFHFVGVTVQSPKKVRYRYKLEGFDNGWSALSDRNEATYGNLTHGTYIFKVKAMNGDGYWSSELTYPFVIRAPWWYTWWAYSLFALLFFAILIFVYRYQINRIKVRHEMVLQKHRTAELEMQALRAQMNPHFIFNSLNSINLFILEHNKFLASDYLSKFSRLMRLILNNSEESFIVLERELEALSLYLELESLRFQDKFSYNITVEDSVDTSFIKVPPLIIQPYAENAILHGLMHKTDQGHLEIKLYQEGKFLYCKIVDDGIGRDKAAQLKSKSASGRKSVGMRITANRLAILENNNDRKTNVMIKDVVLPDGQVGGTEVLLSIPVIFD